MNDLNERIRAIRAALNLTQEELGGKLGITKSGVSAIENGSRNVTEKHIVMLCRFCGVSENYIRNGIKPILIENENSALEALSRENNLSTAEQSMLRAFLSLPPTSRAGVLDYYKALVADTIANYEDLRNDFLNEPMQSAARNDNHDEIRPHLMDEPAHAAPAKTLEEEAVEEAEAYRKEYLQAKKRQTSPASDSGNKRIG